MKRRNARSTGILSGQRECLHTLFSLFAGEGHAGRWARLRLERWEATSQDHHEHEEQ